MASAAVPPAQCGKAPPFRPEDLRSTFILRLSLRMIVRSLDFYGKPEAYRTGAAAEPRMTSATGTPSLIATVLAAAAVADHLTNASRRFLKTFL